VTCVTAADLGRPIAAIVHRCGAPGSVMTFGTANVLVYGEAGRSTIVYFDGDQTRARILQFLTIPPEQSQPIPDWTVPLPFQSGVREIVLGQMTLPDAQSALAADADVTNEGGAAFRSTPETDIVLGSFTDDHVLRSASLGERASLTQMGMIASPLGEAPLAYLAPVPRDAWLKSDGTTGAQSTIYRIDVDASGIVRNVVVIIASGDAAFDASTQAKISDARFRPATLEHRPVSGSCFVQVRH
jgi:TonB family protein